MEGNVGNTAGFIISMHVITWSRSTEERDRQFHVDVALSENRKTWRVVMWRTGLV